MSLERIYRTWDYRTHEVKRVKPTSTPNQDKNVGAILNLSSLLVNHILIEGSVKSGKSYTLEQIARYIPSLSSKDDGSRNHSTGTSSSSSSSSSSYQLLDHVDCQGHQLRSLRNTEECKNGQPRSMVRSLFSSTNIPFLRTLSEKDSNLLMENMYTYHSQYTCSLHQTLDISNLYNIIYTIQQQQFRDTTAEDSSRNDNDSNIDDEDSSTDTHPNNGINGSSSTTLSSSFFTHFPILERLTLEITYLLYHTYITHDNDKDNPNRVIPLIPLPSASSLYILLIDNLDCIFSHTMDMDYSAIHQRAKNNSSSTTTSTTSNSNTDTEQNEKNENVSSMQPLYNLYNALNLFLNYATCPDCWSKAHHDTSTLALITVGCTVTSVNLLPSTLFRTPSVIQPWEKSYSMTNTVSSDAYFIPLEESLLSYSNTFVFDKEVTEKDRSPTKHYRKEEVLRDIFMHRAFTFHVRLRLISDEDASRTISTIQFSESGGLSTSSSVPSTQITSLTSLFAWKDWIGYRVLKERISENILLPILTYFYQLYPGYCSSSLSDIYASSYFRTLLSYMDQLRIKPPTGILLYGPSGNGKSFIPYILSKLTHMAILHIQCPQLLSRYTGDSEAAVRSIFQAARKLSPCILLLDEIDTIATARQGLEISIRTETSVSPSSSSSSSPAVPSQTTASVFDRILATFLNEMDGIGERSTSSMSATATEANGSSKSPLGSYILVIGTTNRPTVLDTALLRAGRLELHIPVPLPNKEDRYLLLKSVLDHQNSLSTDITDTDLQSIAERLEKISCAQVKNLVTEAALLALEKNDPMVRLSYLEEKVQEYIARLQK